MSAKTYVRNDFTRTTRTTVDSELTRVKLFAQMLVDKTELLWKDNMVELGPEYLIQQHNESVEELDALAREILYTIRDLSDHVEKCERTVAIGGAA